MCSIILYKNNNLPYSTALLHIREELNTRKSLPPQQHWQNYPYITAGLDIASQGTWLGLSHQSLLITIVAPVHSYSQQSTQRSRGQLLLDLLKIGHYDAANDYFKTHFNTHDYNDFIILLTTATQTCCWIKKQDTLSQQPIEPGLTMISSHSINNPNCPKYQRVYQEFLTAADNLNPQTNNWDSWINVLLAPKAKTHLYATAGAEQTDLTTVSSALIALSPNDMPVFNYKVGIPERNYSRIKV